MQFEFRKKLKLFLFLYCFIDSNNSKTNVNGLNEVNSPENTLCPDKNEEGLCNCKHRCVVMVLGAGRGPLVRAVLNAASIADVDVKVYFFIYNQI